MQLVKDWFRRHFNDPQVVVLTLLLLTAFVVVIFLGEMLLPVLISLVIAYLLEGVVQVFRRRSIPRWVAVTVVYLVFLTLFAVLIFGILPLITTQLTQALQEVPNMVNRVYSSLMDLPNRYSFIDKERYSRWFGQVITGLRDEITTSTGMLASRVLEFSISSFRGLIVLFVYMVLLPILVFFMLKDKRKIIRWFSGFVPKDSALAALIWRDVDRQIANYIRGKFWEILLVGAATFTTFTFLKMNYPLLLGALVGLSVIVPYVGATMVTFPVAMVAYSQWGVESEFVWAMVAYAIIQTLDGNVLVPLIFSEAVHLHPIAIITAVLVFGGVWGFWGAFFAIPLATLVQAVLKAWPKLTDSTAAPPIPK